MIRFNVVSTFYETLVCNNKTQDIQRIVFVNFRVLFQCNSKFVKTINLPTVPADVRLLSSSHKLTPHCDHELGLCKASNDEAVKICFASNDFGTVGSVGGHICGSSLRCLPAEISSTYQHTKIMIS